MGEVRARKPQEPIDGIVFVGGERQAALVFAVFHGLWK